MAVPRSYRFFACLLGMWIALAPALSLAPAMAMVAAPAMLADGEGSVGDCCPEGEAERALCKLICMNAAQVAVVAEPADRSTLDRDNYAPAPLTEMRGALSPPEPAPPKLASLL